MASKRRVFLGCDLASRPDRPETATRARALHGREFEHRGL
jgi:hypothetical protein